MRVRAQVSTVFHLDKCIGCHTCSLACKNIWTDRRGTEYMWWNNVETKPGTGYPHNWEDQEKFKGGWEVKGGKLRLRLQGKKKTLANIFYNPRLPKLEDYYEPWTYTYDDLFNSPEGDDQPTARPISAITGKPVDITSGPNWDDDLGGSPEHAEGDLDLASLNEEERRQLLTVERMVFFHIPRICNHCLNPACVAACPAGAVYKRGEDGIVLVSQEKCRAWRMCVSGCPYKKVYYNWVSGKSEKCILCYPRLETGQAPACFHSCVGRIRYLGVLLYDADRLTEAATKPDADLVEAQRSMILDPFDEKVEEEAKKEGLDPAVVKAAKESPVYRLVKTYRLALPLHPEYRTMPMLYYVPPLLPVMSTVSKGGKLGVGGGVFTSLDQARIPLKYFAKLFSAGNDAVVDEVYRKLIAVRIYRRSQSVGDVKPEEVSHSLADAHLSGEEAEEIYRLTSLPTTKERYVIPPMMREKTSESAFSRKAQTGAGFSLSPKRRW
ncbi:MAG TPA: nitrate reductase subunit beta [Conexivisphaerales archaeon]|nr:nitrate reductase subunit beta [Conexivisphaerales archaeon]